MYREPRTRPNSPSATSALQKRVEQYAVWYDYPQSYRTSNSVDRLTNHPTRHLYAGQGFHGRQHPSELQL